MILQPVLEGTGPAVLLLHSTAADARQWRPQIRELRGEATVVAPDLRGYGRSPLGSEPFSHAGDVVGLMDRAGTGPLRSGGLLRRWRRGAAGRVHGPRAVERPGAAVCRGRGCGADLARITCKATIVSGNRDLPWAGHLPNLERPTETTQLIRRSIRHRASASAYARRRCQFWLATTL